MLIGGPRPPAQVRNCRTRGPAAARAIHAASSRLTSRRLPPYKQAETAVTDNNRGPHSPEDDDVRQDRPAPGLRSIGRRRHGHRVLLRPSPRSARSVRHSARHSPGHRVFRRRLRQGPGPRLGHSGRRAGFSPGHRPAGIAIDVVSPLAAQIALKRTQIAHPIDPAPIAFRTPADHATMAANDRPLEPRRSLRTQSGLRPPPKPCHAEALRPQR